MFLCVSPNPAIDKRLTLTVLERARVNRARAVQNFPGGKSTHVAMVLRTLGGSPRWIGPCGGASGQALFAGLSALGIQATACTTQQSTRTNLEILEDDGSFTEILEPGSAPSSAEWAEFESACRNLFGEGAENASVIFSGSLPAGAAPKLYADLIAGAREFGCKTFLDTGGEPLRLGLAGKPYFVKPNREEAAQLIGKPVSKVSDAVSVVRTLLSLGAESAALSLGSEGLLFCSGTSAPVLFGRAASATFDGGLRRFCDGGICIWHRVSIFAGRYIAACGSLRCGKLFGRFSGCRPAREYSRVAAADLGANA